MLGTQSSRSICRARPLEGHWGALRALYPITSAAATLRPPVLLTSGRMDAPTPSTAERCSAVCARFNASNYYQLLGMEARSDEPGAATVTLRFSEKVTQLYG